jgi:flagellar M-ring protein FliF
MEDALEAKVIETLEPVTGPGNVRASVTVEDDPASIDVTEESYDPSKVVTLSMQRTEQMTGPQAVAAGVPGTASNAPNSQPLPVYPQQVAPPESAKSESGTYGASKTVRHTMEGPGHIRRLTAAVVVNDRMEAPGTGQQGKQAVWVPRSAGELRTLTALAQAAVGFDSSRGDIVTVQDLAFDENGNAAPASIWSQVLDMAERSPVLVKYGSLLAGLMLFILLVIRPVLGRAAGSARALAEGKTPELAAIREPGALPSPEQATLDAERQRVQRVFDQVTDTLKRDPAQSSRLLQSWIHSD